MYLKIKLFQYSLTVIDTVKVSLKLIKSINVRTLA